MSLIFENITYSYPSITDLALSNVSGVIETGNVTALIGNSGSGKSTLGMILKGLISMDGGSANQLNMDHGQLKCTTWLGAWSGTFNIRV